MFRVGPLALGAARQRCLAQLLLAAPAPHRAAASAEGPGRPAAQLRPASFFRRQRRRGPYTVREVPTPPLVCWRTRVLERVTSMLLAWPGVGHRRLSAAPALKRQGALPMPHDARL